MTIYLILSVILNRVCKMNELSIIMPAYNEEKYLEETAKSHVNYFSTIDICAFELIIICDGGTDNTQNIADHLSFQYPQIRVLYNSKCVGKGGSIKKGLNAANGDIIALIDADGSIEPEEVGKLIRQVRQGFEIAIASRHLPEAQVLIKKPLHWRLASLCFNLLVRLLFRLSIKDTQCGAKVFNRQVIQSLSNDIQINGMLIDVELLCRAKQKNYNIKEIPIVWTHKPKEGKTNNLLKTIVEMSIQVIKLRFRL